MLLSTLLSTGLFSLLAAAIPAEQKRPTKTATVTSTSTCVATGTTSDTPPEPTSTYQSCGGFRIQQKPCPTGQICIDDPYRGGCGMACDAPGICVTPTFCGGFAGLRCRDGRKMCVDDPRDDCDPKNGGADCGGICV
ncbi:hypothetical protein NKR19_g5730 [Coniochaeta hoffmannii]|uniref:Uncharacterized protein n=1 Tax=Coniochaeta hoffmannii TaxID=91930 RepID=A0AA38RWA1_9PEZI|nr:hypothetical protein NKR19_g5730 [Coniochaeta hoffmannii]